MSLEQAILDRLEKRNGQIAQLQSTVNALERAADSQREHAMMERGRLLEENKQLAAQIESDEKVSQSNREHAQYQIASLTAEVAKLRAEVPLDSARDVLMNAVANMHELTKEKDRMRLQLENARADLKQALVERDSLGTMAADRALEIRKLMDGHAEDMKAQAELTARLDSAKGESEEWLMQCHAARRQRDEIAAEVRKETHIVYQIADKLGRNQAESIPEFMERQALRLAALESKIELRPIENRIGHFAVICTKCDELAKAMARTKPLEALYKTLKGYQDSDSIIGNGTIIEVAIDKATEALSQLTA